MAHARARIVAALVLLLGVSSGSASAGETDAVEVAWRELVGSRARDLAGAADLTPLIEAAGSRSLVLLGESTHGSHEFYTWRAAISRRLIEEKDFTFVAVEGDWPVLARLDDYVRGRPDAPASAVEALRGVTRWPAWMWRNPEFAAFAEWLHGHNLGRPESARVGLHGMDVYGLDTALAALRARVATLAPDLVGRLAVHLDCIAAHVGDGSGYARALAAGEVTGCEASLAEAETLLAAAGADWPEPARFDVQRNLRVLRNGEAYYRLSTAPDASSWNRRIGHMWETVAALLDRPGPARGIVWAHNTHVGDAHYTGMAWYGMDNIGRLARQDLGADRTYIVGFGSWRGQVRAATAWGEPERVMTMPAALPGSLEDLLARARGSDFLLLFGEAEREHEALNQTLGQRGIGVVYQSQDEAPHYLPTRVPWRYDALIMARETSALGVLD